MRGNFISLAYQSISLELVECTLPRTFVGSPADQTSAVSKPVARDVVVANLDYELRFDWLPWSALCSNDWDRREPCR